MVTQQLIVERITDVATDRLSVYDFEQWLDLASWGMHRDGTDARTTALVEELQHVFFELKDAAVDEDRARVLIAQVVAGLATYVEFRMPKVQPAVTFTTRSASAPPVRRSLGRLTA